MGGAREVSRSEFATLAGVSRPAVSKAEACGRVIVTPEGMIRSTDEVNALYLQQTHMRAMDRILSSGTLAPGWACLTVLVGGKRLPLFYYPPSGREILQTEHAEDYAVDLRKAETATGPDGKTYKLHLVTHPKAAPPWLTTSEPPRTKRPARRKA